TKLVASSTGCGYSARRRQTRNRVPRRVAGGALVVVERHFGAGETGGELLRFAGAENRRGEAGLSQNPRERDRHARLTARLEKRAQPFDRFQHRLVPVAFAIQLARLAEGEARVRWRRFQRAIFAAEEAAGERIVRDYSQPLIATQGQQFGLDVAVQHVVA